MDSIVQEKVTRFCTWYAKAFPGAPVPVLPKQESDLPLTTVLAMKSEDPALAQLLFAGANGHSAMPADVVMRRNQGQSIPQDAQHLRRAGLEAEAQAAEARGQRLIDQQLVDQARQSREDYQQAMQKSAAWREMGILQRMGHQPLTSEQIAENRRRYHGKN